MNEKSNDSRFMRLLKRGTSLLQNGKPQQATSYLERARQLETDNFDANLNLSGAYILTKKFKKAVPILEKLREDEPLNVMVWTNLGAAYLGNPVLARPEEQERAIAAFKKAYDLNPATPHVAYNIGLIYKDRRENDIAIQWFQKAVRTNPRDKDAHAILARLQRMEDEDG